MPRGRKDMPPGPGRPPGSKNKLPLELAQLIREQTASGQELVDLALGIMRGGGRKTRVSDQIECLKWLADRGWGKAKELIEIHGDVKVSDAAEHFASGLSRLASRSGTGSSSS